MSENKIAATMIQHVGTKMVKRSAEPMTKKEYCDYRGWDLPEAEDGAEMVYLVEYAEDPRNKPNHLDHKGYITMSPVYIFDESYNRCETYVDRLEIEHDELDAKCDKLIGALAGNLIPEGAKPILKTQYNAMQAYLGILKLRMEEDKAVKMNKEA